MSFYAILLPGAGERQSRMALERLTQLTRCQGWGHTAGFPTSSQWGKPMPGFVRHS
jgi:hypothetical protein